MRNAFLALSAFLLIWSTGSQAFAQENPNQTEKSKNAVELAVEEARKHGETVLGSCLQDCEGAPKLEGVEPGRAIELAKPVYPPIARAAKATGSVEVQMLIDVDGSVIAATAISGHPLLMSAAVSAARETRFTPTKLNGQPVKVTGIVVYNFLIP